MAILKIARLGHPVLRRRAEPVPDPQAPEIARLVADMIETMHDAGGVGLAAPQVHVPLRLFVFHVPHGRTGGDAADPSIDDTAVINPELQLVGDERVEDWEGCLSIPGLRGVVPRAPRVAYRGWDVQGRAFEREAGGFHARVVQHEYDHLDGVVYPMRMTELGTLGFADELRRFEAAAGDRA
jgi:peptide deformylase